MRIRKVALPLTLDYSEDDDLISGTVEINGIFKGASITVPDLEYAGGTVTASILNSEGGTVWSKASIAESATTSVFTDANNAYFNQPLYGKSTLKIQTNTGQTADRSFIFYVYYE
jgi:uncharacterized protein (DUF2141 family)